MPPLRINIDYHLILKKTSTGKLSSPVPILQPKSLSTKCFSLENNSSILPFALFRVISWTNLFTPQISSTVHCFFRLKEFCLPVYDLLRILLEAKKPTQTLLFTILKQIQRSILPESAFMLQQVSANSLLLTAHNSQYNSSIIILSKYPGE